MRIELQNDAGFANLDLIEQVIDVSDLPDGRLLLLLSPKSAPAFGTEGPFLGLFLGKRFAKYAPRVDGIFRGRSDRQWDFAVALFREALANEPENPAYLAFLLAHELEHARIAAEEPEALVLADLIRSSIRDASSDQISQHQETPEEVQCDKAGKRVAVTIFGEEAFALEMNRLADAADPSKSSERFRYLAALDPAAGEGSLMTRLRRFAMPYREALETDWIDRKQRETDSMLELVPDLTMLLDE